MLNGKKVTCFHSIKDDITNAGLVYCCSIIMSVYNDALHCRAQYEDAAVVVDGNLVSLM